MFEVPLRIEAVFFMSIDYRGVDGLQKAFYESQNDFRVSQIQLYDPQTIGFEKVVWNEITLLGC